MNGLRAAVAAPILAFAALAHAHNVALWAEVRENRIWVETYDTEGAGLANAKIVVEDSDGKVLLEGKTDDKGKFDFPPPNRNEMVLKLILDEHHKSKFTLKAEDLEDVVLDANQPGP